MTPATAYARRVLSRLPYGTPLDTAALLERAWLAGCRAANRKRLGWPAPLAERLEDYLRAGHRAGILGGSNLAEMLADIDTLRTHRLIRKHP